MQTRLVSSGTSATRHLGGTLPNASSKTSDLVFSVGEKEFRAYKLILSIRGKKVYEIAKDCDSDVPIPLHSVSADIFKSILEFVRTVKTPEISRAKTLLPNFLLLPIAMIAYTSSFMSNLSLWTNSLQLRVRQSS